MRDLTGFVVGVAAAVLMLPVTVWAQSSGIAGVVRDTSGAVLPGVTVEASSPALIERVRTVTTDTQGRYNIVDLRPGTYSVTFTLTGFTPVRREGVELPAAFTATDLAAVGRDGVAVREAASAAADGADPAGAGGECVGERAAAPAGHRLRQRRFRRILHVGGVH